MTEQEMRYCDGCSGWVPVSALYPFEGLATVQICEECQAVWRHLFDAWMWACCDVCNHVWQAGELACPECGLWRWSSRKGTAPVEAGYCAGCQGPSMYDLHPFEGLPSVVACEWCRERWRNIYLRAVMAYCPICSHEWRPEEMRCPCCRTPRQR